MRTIPSTLPPPLSRASLALSAIGQRVLSASTTSTIPSDILEVPTAPGWKTGPESTRTTSNRLRSSANPCSTVARSNGLVIEEERLEKGTIERLGWEVM
ncbi:MAG: hypothetical protein A2V77_17215 [Anaeromyxobacter sp. RBG_16_69_14]|nr:MAG: hypothetical protein A2V77_17215 [Anaeromyxobacter sp. RBG_16_69_14]